MESKQPLPGKDFATYLEPIPSSQLPQDEFLDSDTESSPEKTKSPVPDKAPLQLQAVAKEEAGDEEAKKSSLVDVNETDRAKEMEKDSEKVEPSSLSPKQEVAASSASQGKGGPPEADEDEEDPQHQAKGNGKDTRASKKFLVSMHFRFFSQTLPTTGFQKIMSRVLCS